MATFTFRAPEDWNGKLDSKRVQQWLEEHLKKPVVLPADPGAGKLRVSISVSNETSKIIRCLKQGTISGAVRRIISRNIRQSSRVGQPQSIEQHSQQPENVCGDRSELWAGAPQNRNHAKFNVITEKRLSFGPVRYVMGLGFPRLNELATAAPGVEVANSSAAFKRKESMISSWAVFISIILVVAIFAWVLSRGRSPESSLLARCK